MAEPPQPTDGAETTAEAALEALDAAVEAIDDDLMQLYLHGADGQEIGPQAARVADLAERMAHAAGELAEALHVPPPPEPTATELLTDAQAALDEALAALDDALDDAPDAIAAAADRVEQAASTVVDLARTVALWSVDLDALAPPADFVTPPFEPSPTAPAEDRISALVLDTDRVYVAWSITVDGRTRARRALLADDPPVLTLRTYLEGAGRADVIDHAIEEWVGQTPMDIADRAGSTLVCAVGLVAGGVFAHIARAEAVTLPAPAPTAEPRFARADWLDGSPTLVTAERPS